MDNPKKGEIMEIFQNAAEELKKEYQCFLDYLNFNEVQLSKRTGHIGKKDCFALNRLFCIVNERYNSYGRSQDYYAVIDFFYFFSVRSGILQVVKKRGKGLTTQKSQRYGIFAQMAAMEQYILMMAVWLGEYQEAIADSFPAFWGKRIFEAMQGVETGAVVPEPSGGRIPAPWGNRYIPEIRLFALFQLIHIEWLEEKEEDNDNKFRIKALYQTEAGNFLDKLFQKQSRKFWYNLSVDTVVSVLNDVINNCSVSTEEKLMHFWANPVESGLHTVEFKIIVGSCMRRIKIGDQFTLEDLHYLIQKSIDFDSDHLYYFQIGSGTSRRRYFAPECEDDPWLADTVSLAELPLYEGMEFEYLFDFGDQWRFQIKVEHILSGHTGEYEISKIKGEAPEQYSCDW